MNEILLEENGYPKIYTIHSQKGGVGKTSIALALAGITGAMGKKTLIIDGDMTGASIADIPKINGEIKSNFNKLILAKPNEFLQYTAMWPSKRVGQAEDMELKFCRQMAGHDMIYFIPSSAASSDVESVVPLIAQEDHLHFFRHRMEDILTTAIHSGFETIILDHSPGLFGFSKTTLQMGLEWGLPQGKRDHRLLHLLNGRSSEPTLQSILVSSFEPHDYKAVLLSFQYVMDRLRKAQKEDNKEYQNNLANSFRFVFNKARNIYDSVEELDKMFSMIGGMSEALKKTIRDHEKEFGAQLAPFIEGFEMGDIFSRAASFISEVKSGSPGTEWYNWFSAIAYRARLIKI